MRLTTEPLLKALNYVALLYGPIVLAAVTGTEDLAGLRAGEGPGDHISPGRLLPLDGAPALVVDEPDNVIAAITRSGANWSSLPLR